MSTDAGNAAAPEDSATEDVSSERPGLESSDPEAADSATATPETADRGVEGSAGADADPGADGRDGDDDEDREPVLTDATGAPEPRADQDQPGEGFVAGLLRDATITGLPGDTGPEAEDDDA